MKITSEQGRWGYIFVYENINLDLVEGGGLS